jgi:competence protein ComEC
MCAKKLSVTLIDVGWGDSIFIEHTDDAGNDYYGLIDSNDEHSVLSSFIFLKRYFERTAVRIPDDKPVFSFVMLSHAHSDHGQGLKNIMRHFGTRYFCYPKSIDWSSLVYLVRYGNLSSNVVHHEAVDENKDMPSFGDVELKVHWPFEDDMSNQNENDNSIVLSLRLDNVSFVLTGDAEEDVWAKVSGKIPTDTRFFKVPHHGSRNGSLDHNGNGVWIDDCPNDALLGISCHILPFDHPHDEVIQLFQDNGRDFLRTDDNYHLTFQTDGRDLEVKSSRLTPYP